MNVKKYARGGKPVTPDPKRVQAMKSMASVRDNTSTNSQYKSPPAVSKAQSGEIKLKTQYVLADAAKRKAQNSFDQFNKEADRFGYAEIGGKTSKGERDKLISATEKKSQAKLRLARYQEKMK